MKEKSLKGTQTEKNLEAATAIEPLEEVVDDLINTLQDNHLVRLRDGKCTVTVGMHFLNILTNLERISDVCSDIGVATIARRNPELANQAHEYISSLHIRHDSDYADAYKRAHDEYFGKPGSHKAHEELHTTYKARDNY